MPFIGCVICGGRYWAGGDPELCPWCFKRKMEARRERPRQNVKPDLSRGCKGTAVGCGIAVGVLVFLLLLVVTWI